MGGGASASPNGRIQASNRDRVAAWAGHWLGGVRASDKDLPSRKIIRVVLALALIVGIAMLGQPALSSLVGQCVPRWVAIVGGLPLGLALTVRRSDVASFCALVYAIAALPVLVVTLVFGPAAFAVAGEPGDPESLALWVQVSLPVLIPVTLACATGLLARHHARRAV